jgi:hypothetical protein
MTGARNDFRSFLIHDKIQMLNTRERCFPSSVQDKKLSEKGRGGKLILHHWFRTTGLPFGNITTSLLQNQRQPSLVQCLLS